MNEPEKRTRHRLYRMRRLAVLLIVLASSGCATLSTDGGFGPVATNVRERTGAEPRWMRSDDDAASVRKLVDERIARPLTADDAVQIALVNNPGLQASYAELGIAEADLVRAGRLPNPKFSFSRIANSASVEIERKLVVDIVGILLAPLTIQLERGRLAAVQTATAAHALRVAADARKAWVSAVAAAESVRYGEQVQLAAEASAELARRMAEVGNWSRLSQAREQVFYADATAQLARARYVAVAERERLARLLGLGGGDRSITLPERLPDLPAAPRVLSDLEGAALAQRLDVQLARQGLDATGFALGLTKATRFVSVFDAAYKNKSDTGASLQSGYEVEIEVPLFDWGDAKVAKAEAIYRQAASRLAEAADGAQSEARTAYHAYRTTYDLARHYRDEIVPLRKKIAEENLLRYNGMLLSVFELLADAREQVQSVNGAIEATRDFWLADADLQAAIAGGSSVSGVARLPVGAGATVAREAH
jgi:outer membrane protein TolC